MIDPLTTPTPVSFKNALEIEAYLIAAPRSWKIKKSSIYNHIKAHKLIAEKDGSFTRAEVDRYALACLRKADGSTPSAQLTAADKVALDAADHRLRREKAQARMFEIKVDALEGQLVPRGAFESELAARAAIFRADFETLFRSKAPEIIALVAGDAVKTPDLIAWGLDQVELVVSRYLNKEEFKVDMSAYEKIFEAAGKDEEEEPEEIDDDNA